MNWLNLKPGAQIPGPLFDPVADPVKTPSNPMTSNTGGFFKNLNQNVIGQNSDGTPQYGTSSTPFFDNLPKGYMGKLYGGGKAAGFAENDYYGLNPTTNSLERLYRIYMPDNTIGYDEGGSPISGYAQMPWHGPNKGVVPENYNQRYYFNSDPEMQAYLKKFPTLSSGVYAPARLPDDRTLGIDPVLQAAVMALTGAAAGGLAAGAGTTAGTEGIAAAGGSGVGSGGGMGGVSAAGGEEGLGAMVGNTTAASSPEISAIAAGGEPFVPSSAAAGGSAFSPEMLNGADWSNFAGEAGGTGGDFADLPFTDASWGGSSSLWDSVPAWLKQNSGTLGLLGNILSLYGDNRRQQQLNDVGSNAVNNSDPWRTQAPRYYGPLYDAVTKGIGSTAYGQSLTDATARKMASMGYNLSTNQMNEIASSLNRGTMDYVNAVGPLATGRASNPMAQVLPGIEAANADNQKVGDVSRFLADALKNSGNIADTGRSLAQMFGLS